MGGLFTQNLKRPQLIYTTNAIEGFNRQFRKVTKNKSVFPTDNSFLKMLYLAMRHNQEMDWPHYSQLEIYFEDRIK